MKTGEVAAPSPAPSSAQSFHEQAGGSSHCQRNSVSKRARSASPEWVNNLPSCFEDTMDHPAMKRRRTGPLNHEQAPRDDAAPRPSKNSSPLAPAPRAAQKPAPHRKRERGRTMLRNRDLYRQFVEDQDSQHSAKRKRSCSPPQCDQTPGHDAAPEPSNTNSKQAPGPKAAQEPALPRQQQQSRSPQQVYNLRSRCVVITVCDSSAGRRTRPLNRGRAPRDDAAPGPSNTSSKRAPAPRAVWEPALPRQRERSRSPQSSPQPGCRHHGL